MRVGLGYDVHAFGGRGRLVLGGVDIEFDRALEGHSDADALTHAVIDAVLGAAGLADIGTVFPADERFRNASSIELLRIASGMVRAEGFTVVNVDATVVAEEPRLGPYRDLMRETLSAAIDAAVSVKATTTDGLGFAGRREGIAAMAIALVE